MKKRQHGMSMSQIMFTLVAIGAAAVTGITMIPVYIDNSTVMSGLNSVQEEYADADIQELSNTKIKQKLQAIYQVNMLDREIEESLKIKREKRKIILTMNYEIKKPLVGNVSVVMTFNNEVILGK